MFYVLALFSLQWFILLNRTRSLFVFSFRSGRFINGELSVCKNEFQQNIQTTFKMINSYWTNCEQIFNNRNN
jgi:hypothetical protein